MAASAEKPAFTAQEPKGIAQKTALTAEVAEVAEVAEECK
jgi:hypothetical protein